MATHHTLKHHTKSNAFQRFLHQECAPGILLMVGTALAIIAANSPLAGLYNALLDIPFKVGIGGAGAYEATAAGVKDGFNINKPLLLWINDGLMALFFLLVGLEIKREVLAGHLRKPSRLALPALAAFGGLAIPALVYVAFNWGDPVALNGWAIPAATDIAFALGILALLGNRVPAGLKIFLMTLAVLDDLAAIIIIALFYSGDLSISALVGAGIFTGLLILVNRMQLRHLGIYSILGICLWVCVLKSGVHATLAGVVLAFCIPFVHKKDMTSPPIEGFGKCPLRVLEYKLHLPVYFIVLPIFAFANAGLALAGMTLEGLLHPVTLGIALGLFIGKPLGIFGMTFLATKVFKLIELPEGFTLLRLLGVGYLAGIGFTMSLFIAGLAFEHTGPGGAEFFMLDRMGILLGSLLSGITGYLLLRLSLKKA